MNKVDCRTVETVLVRFIRDSIHKNGFQRGLVGVSGGLDSAVILALVRKALGKTHTFALLMPYRLSAKESMIHGRLICTRLGVPHELIDISPMVDAFFRRYPTDNPVQVGNKCARERMSVLYDFSVRKRAMVVGTSNKSELLVGYSTLYGDSAAAFMPIGDLYKTQVYQLGRHLKIPEEIIQKKPSADLWKNQTDEGEIGMSYDQLDEILYRLVDLRQRPDEIAAGGYSAKAIDKVKRMIVRSQFKRTMPPIAKLQPRTIGIDFRYLRDWNK
jgi:NAD+ synthase